MSDDDLIRRRDVLAILRESIAPRCGDGTCGGKCVACRIDAKLRALPADPRAAAAVRVMGAADAQQSAFHRFLDARPPHLGADRAVTELASARAEYATALAEWRSLPKPLPDDGKDRQVQTKLSDDPQPEAPTPESVVADETCKGCIGCGTVPRDPSSLALGRRKPCLKCGGAK